MTDDLPALPEPYTPNPLPERVKFRIGSTKGLNGKRVEWHAVEIDDCEAHARAEVARRDAQWQAAVAQRDEQIAALRADLAQAQRNAAADRQSLVALQIEVDGLRADAERYRWLRERSDTMAVSVVINGNGSEIAETLDAAIDAARAEAPRSET